MTRDRTWNEIPEGGQRMNENGGGLLDYIAVLGGLVLLAVAGASFFAPVMEARLLEAQAARDIARANATRACGCGAHQRRDRHDADAAGVPRCHCALHCRRGGAGMGANCVAPPAAARARTVAGATRRTTVQRDARTATGGGDARNVGAGGTGAARASAAGSAWGGAAMRKQKPAPVGAGFHGVGGG